MRNLIYAAAFLGAALVIGGCSLESNTAAEGIIIYYGKDILNEKNLDIIADRVTQLRAVVVPSGDAVEWSTNNPNAMTVNETGRVRASKTSGRIAVITAASKNNSSIKSKVTFRVVDQR